LPAKSTDTTRWCADNAALRRSSPLIAGSRGHDSASVAGIDLAIDDHAQPSVAEQPKGTTGLSDDKGWSQPVDATLYLE